MNGTWVWEIATGRLYTDAGDLLAIGYSGSPAYKNDIKAVSLHNEGPIPPGVYTIQAPRDTVTHGPYALPLEPSPSNVMYGRAGFLIHGDSVHAPGTASEGCIILPRAIRTEIWESGDHTLNVIEQAAPEQLEA